MRLFFFIHDLSLLYRRPNGWFYCSTVSNDIFIFLYLNINLNHQELIFYIMETFTSVIIISSPQLLIIKTRKQYFCREHFYLYHFWEWLLYMIYLWMTILHFIFFHSLNSNSFVRASYLIAISTRLTKK